MKIGSLITKLPTILKMVGMGKVDIKEELNGLPKILINMITKEEANIGNDLTTGILSIKNQNNELLLVPVGFSVQQERAVITQQLEPINVTRLINDVDLKKLGDLLDDENSKLSFLEKLEASKNN